MKAWYSLGVFSPSAPLITRTLPKIKSFSLLESAWHYGKGGPISEEVIRRAVDLHEHFLLLGFTQNDAFPGTEGEILLTAYHLTNYVSLTVEKDNTFSVNYEVDDNDELYEEGLSEEKAKARLRQIAGKIWNTSGFSIGEDLTTIQVSSQTWYSRTPQIAAECQSYSWSALKSAE